MSTSSNVALVGNTVTLVLIGIRNAILNAILLVGNTVSILEINFLSLRNIEDRTSSKSVFIDSLSNGTEAVDQLGGVGTGRVNPQTNYRVINLLL